MRKELLVFLAFMFLQCGVQAQCPIINMAMVNSCGAAEGPNEFLAFTTTATTTVGSYKLYYGSNNPPSSPSNTLSGAAARTQSGTGSIVATGCNIIYVTNSTTIIPTDSRVVFIPADFDQKYDLSALCYGGNIYVVFIDRTGSSPTWSSGGNFSNNPGTSTNRYIQLTNSASTCTSEIRSYKTGWSSNLDGNFVSWNSAGVATYGNNGCDFNSLPSITPQTITPICLGTSAVNMDFSTTGTPDKYSIVWNAAAITDGFTNITLAALTVSPLSISIPTTATATVYSGTITVTNSTTSTTSLPQSFSITINPLPATPTVNITQPTCTISTGTITITPVAGLTYSIDGINFSATTSFTGLAQGNYTITAKSAAGCTATTTATINAPLAAPAAPTVITPITYCQNANATALTATGANLTWYTSATATTGSTTAPIPSTTTAGSTIYYVTQTVTDCESPKAAITVQVNPLPVTPTINITQPTCATPTGTITITSVAGLTYSIDGINFSANTSFTGLAQGNYTIYAKSTAGCNTKTSATINAPLAAPTAPTVITPITYCQNATAMALTATGANLTWYTTATATTGSAIAPIPSTTTAGSTIYYVTQNVTGCESPKAAITVQVSAPSTSTINATICNGSSYILNGINYNAAGTYTAKLTNRAGCDSIVTLNLTVSTFKLTLITTSNPIYAGSPFAARIAGTSSIVNSYWQPPSLFINDQSQQNITAPNASFILKVLGVSANGCKDSITQPITIITPNKIVYIPNAMSPGSNGGEDVTTLKIYGSYIKSATMYIYNQWGQLIFQNENPLTIGWDGKYKGVAQPSGVYMYAVKITYLDDTKETKSGSINLIR